MLPYATQSPLIGVFPNILAIIDDPIIVTGLSLMGALAALAFTVGYGDRVPAFIMWFTLACFLGRNPLITNPSLPYVGWMLLAHLFIPTAPFGSVKALGRTNPAGDWRFPAGIFLAALLVLVFSYSGYTKLLSPSWVAGENVQFVLTNPLARDWFLRDIFLTIPPIVLKLLTWFILDVELLFLPLALSRKLRPWLWSGMLFV